MGETSLISRQTVLFRRVCRTRFIMARPESFTTSQRAQSVSSSTRRSSTDTSRSESTSVSNTSPSRSREEFVRRVKQNAELKKKSKTDGTHVHLKRQPLMPREARTISMKDNVPETVVPIAYETTI